MQVFKVRARFLCALSETLRFFLDAGWELQLEAAKGLIASATFTAITAEE